MTHRHGLAELLWHRHVVAGEGDVGIRLLGAEQLHVVGARDDLEPAVLLVRGVDATQAGDTGAWVQP